MNAESTVSVGQKALWISVSFTGWTNGLTAERAPDDSEADIADYLTLNFRDFDDDPTTQALHAASVGADIANYLTRLDRHYGSIGAFRADGILPPADGGGWRSDAWTISYFLVVAPDLDPQVIPSLASAITGAVGQIIPLAAFPGAVVTFSTDVAEVDPKGLFGALGKLDTLSGVEGWGGIGVPERLPRPKESRAAWLNRVAVSAEAMEQTLYRWERSGRDIDLYARYSAPRKEASPDWLVEGIVAFGSVTLLVGSGAAGKSSAAHELLSAAAGRAVHRPKSFFGREIMGSYPTALFCGEESDWIVDFRRAKHETIWADCECMVFPGSADDLEAGLAALSKIQGGVLVVDPVQSYMRGDDTKSYVASEFYTPLVDFARRYKWAVVVVHHLVKSPANSLARMIPSVKGATVHTDRARMVIAMIDRGNDIVEVGPIKHNFPAELVWLKTNEGQFLRRDPDTYTLVPIEVSTQKAAPSPEGCDDKIIAAVARMNAAGTKVQRTGRSGLFEMKPAELAGLSRSVVQASIGALTEAGRIVPTAKGLQVVLDAHSGDGG